MLTTKKCLTSTCGSWKSGDTQSANTTVRANSNGSTSSSIQASKFANASITTRSGLARWSKSIS
jgi:hypothetical protein